MTTWVVISWIFVGLLTAGNVFFFLKLKKASDQMMKAAFPGSKNMTDAMSQMQTMMSGMQKGGMRRPPVAGGAQMQSQMKMAMDMLAQMQKGKRK